MKKKILVLDIKDKKTIPQAIIQNVLWYETINEGKSYVRIQLHWFKFMICQRIKKKKLQIFCAFVARSQGLQSGSVSYIYFRLKNRPKDILILGEWTRF